MLDLLLILGGLVLLAAGAEGLVRGGAALAGRLGLTPLVIGLTVVALGTSSPELIVSLESARSGRAALALGNVVGSNISNIALILGLTVLIRPPTVQLRLLRFDVPLLLGCSLLLVPLLLTGDRLGRLEGSLFVLGLAAYLLVVVRAATREPGPVRQEFAQAVPEPTGAVWRDVLFVLVGIGLLVGGGHLLVEGAVAVGRRAGLSEAVIGLTIVAVGTSLPELATSVVAAARGEADIAVGNVVGSNIFNILCILGFTALVEPIRTDGFRFVDLGVMLFFTLLLLPLMRTGLHLSRWEGGLLLALYGTYLLYLL